MRATLRPGATPPLRPEAPAPESRQERWRYETPARAAAAPRHVADRWQQRPCSLRTATCHAVFPVTETGGHPRARDGRRLSQSVRLRPRLPAAVRRTRARIALHPLPVGSRARQARRTLDLLLPGRADLLDQARRQRHVVQLSRHLGTVVIGP